MIRTLGAAYSYGLNDQVGDDYRKAKTELVRVKFPSLTRTRSKTRVMKYNYANKISGKGFICKLNKILKNNLPNSMIFYTPALLL